MICSNCGKENKDSNTFCTKCGSPLNGNDASLSQNAADGGGKISLNKEEPHQTLNSPPAQSESGVQKPTDVNSKGSDGTVYCSNCGASNPAEFKFCNSCGAQMGQTATRTRIIKEEKVIVEAREDSIPTLGIVSLVIGIIAFCCSFGAPVVGLILAIIADVCGAKSHTAMGTEEACFPQ